MKKIVVFLFVAIATVSWGSLSSQTSPTVPTASQIYFPPVQREINWREIPGFVDSYQQILKLNQKRFKDVNNIQIGDTVLVPSKFGIGVEAWIADKPIANNGQNDCLWLINKRYLLGQLKTAPIDTIRVIQLEPVQEKAETAELTLLGIFKWLLLLIVTGVGFLLLAKVIKSVTSANPDRNPVIPGGLSDEPLTALQQIETAYPNRPRALKVQRVILNGPEGIDSVTVRMTFSDGVRNSLLRSGEIGTRVEREGGIVDFYRQHCGNIFGEIFQGGYNLPDGWTWTVVSEAEVPVEQAAEEAEEQAIPETPAPPAPVNNTVNQLNADDIVKIISALKDSTLKPETINFGSVQIVFFKEKKNRK